MTIDPLEAHHAESKGVSLSDLIDEALLGMARADRFEMPPER